ncbi:MAG: hypothetical protein CFE36_11275 [Sphingomonadaceae bacterium PASS1]|nr:MAG: hypothetical protein CFE36_11275 [Sphingomonadaceae bacterium PASS1]
MQGSVLNAVQDISNGRPYKFAALEIMHGFLALERKRRGILHGQLSEKTAFHHAFLSNIICWTAGKDTYVQGFQELLVIIAPAGIDEADDLVRAMITEMQRDGSYEQRRRASFPRTTDAFNRYVLRKLAVNPKLSERQLLQEIEKDAQLGGSIRIIVGSEDVEITDHDANDFAVVERSAIRGRLTRLKKKLFIAR